MIKTSRLHVRGARIEDASSWNKKKKKQRLTAKMEASKMEEIKKKKRKYITSRETTQRNRVEEIVSKFQLRANNTREQEY